MSDDEAADRLPSSLKPQLRLTRTDRLRLLLLVLLGAASLWLGFSLYDRVFPEATIRFDVGRKESRQQAERWLAERGWPLAGYRYASAFSYADTAKTFLEKELGLEEMDRIVAERARIWKWSHRWFRPLQEEEFLVEITPGGELAGFDHVLGEKVPGAKLDVPQARAIAEAELRHLRPEGLDGLRFLGATTRNLDMRADHSFTWELAGVDWKGGRYRYEVTIRGDHLGGYRQYVKVPEEWVRSYAGLRSKNEAAGAVDSVFFVLTALAMVVVLFLNARRGLVRWRFALTFGIVGASLLFLSSLNSLPQALYGYDTTKSFGGFLSETILMSLLGAIGLGVLLTVLVGAGESEYREHFPRKLSLARLFRWQGLRTKEFLFSAVGGFALTCFFLAYQTVFYLAASKLGAWSPAEVPYDELLNSAFPWAFLLFIGFLPAVSEEFMSRAFSIPFFHRLFKSRWLAVVLAAFIWGFGHSTYPNQPFYIRGLEVGLAGVLIGVLMIRFNVLALLVWHYTVDAMYSGYLLLRSGNPYYVTTTILAGCVMLLPLAVAIVAYLRTGRFADPEPMRHENDATAPKPIEEAEASVEAAAASAAAGGSEPVASEDTGARAGVI
ncbi:MAG: CPBP family intramembrane metalloprotease, partial [Candidatus Eisenbacteria bacterium]|nr:CPBP family intramembrane metalloprotease [Candidatus Eisenbacteria bacterium]